MSIFKLKACQRCGGDLAVDRADDGDGWESKCIQCSHTRELKPLAVRKKVKVAR